MQWFPTRHFHLMYLPPLTSSSAMMCSLWDFCHRGRRGWDPAKHPINQWLTVPQLSHLVAGFVFLSLNKMNLFRSLSSFLFLICTKYGTKIYEWDDLKNPDFPYASLEVDFRSLYTHTQCWCWCGQVAEVELRNSSSCPGIKERVTYYK